MFNRLHTNIRILLEKKYFSITILHVKPETITLQAKNIFLFDHIVYFVEYTLINCMLNLVN